MAFHPGSRLAVMEPGSVGASGRMSFVTKSMPQMRNYRDVKEATDEYKKCSSPHAADSGAKISFIRYSELHSLPYFTTVDHFLIDPMRNLFLGVVEDIGNAITEGNARCTDSNGRDVISKHRFLVKKSCRCLLLRIWVLLSIQL